MKLPIHYCSNVLFVEALDELTRVALFAKCRRLVVQRPHTGGYKSVCGSLEESAMQWACL